MRTLAGWAMVGAVPFLAGGAPAPGAALAGDDAPKTPAEAMEKARPILDDAIKSAPVANKDTKDFKVIADTVGGALTLLKDHSKEGFKLPAFQAIWNEGVSLAHYHGLKPIPEYQLVPKQMAFYPIRMAVPAGRGWELKDLRPERGDQQWGEVARTLPNGRVVRQIKVWVYLWNTVYSDVGGENAKGLAEMAMEADREGMAKVTFRSSRIVTTRLCKGFPKTSYYEIAGEDGKLGPVRRRNYYVKGTTATYQFEVIELRKTAAEDDAWTKWQTEGDDPELDAVLESLEDVGGKKK